MKLRIASPVICDSIVDGPGLRMVIWTQGCKHNCKGCHNPQTLYFENVELLKYIDVLVDGRFELDKRDISLLFRGSSNQRIIDVKKSLKYKTAVLKFEYMQEKQLYTAK